MEKRRLLQDGAATSQRVAAIDLFKFFVLFFMIQGHLFRAYLLPAIRQASWYQIHEVFHGVVAPGFLFSAGFAAFLAFQRKREQYIHLDRALFRRLRRILFLIWAGYWIHLPYLSLRKCLQRFAQGQDLQFFAVDILQCIGVGLLLFSLSAVLLKGEKIVAAFSFFLCLLFFFVPQLVKGSVANMVLHPYLDYRVSFFPLFPWVGFLFAGAVVAFIYSRVRAGLFFPLLLVIGLLIFPWIFFQSSEFYYKSELTWAGNLNKFGGVFLLFWTCHWLGKKFHGRFLELLKKAGKESLFVYILHLWIIFNSIFSYGLYNRFRDSLTVISALGLFLVIQLAVFLLALFYGYLKEKQCVLWRLGFVIFWAVFFTVFLLRPH